MPLTPLSAALALVASLLAASNLAAQDRQTEAELRSPDSYYTVRASDVIGATVVNADGVELGKVDDIVIVRTTGELHAIISTGGILGIGNELYAVAFDELKAGSTDDRVFLDMTEERLRGRSEFTYVKGEARGEQIWEKRLKLKEKLEDKRKDVQGERKDVAEKQREIRELERELEALRKQ